MRRNCRYPQQEAAELTICLESRHCSWLQGEPGVGLWLTCWRESREVQSEAFRSNFKRRSERDGTTTYPRCANSVARNVRNPSASCRTKELPSCWNVHWDYLFICMWSWRIIGCMLVFCFVGEGSKANCYWHIDSFLIRHSAGLCTEAGHHWGGSWDQEDAKACWTWTCQHHFFVLIEFIACSAVTFVV